MRASKVHAVARDDAVAGLTARQQALVVFAEKLTRAPLTFSVADTEAVRWALGDEGEVVEAANVVAGFNFANRVADTLGVPTEVPASLRRYDWSRTAIMRLMSMGIRMRMNLKNRPLGSASPEDVLENLQQALRRADWGALPSYFQWLRVRPHILAGQAAICHSLLFDTGLSRPTLLRMGYLVSSLNDDLECAQEFARLLRAGDLPLEPINRITSGKGGGVTISGLEEELLCFARDITLRAHEITDEQVASLRAHGLSDVQILNAVLITAAHNAGNRLNRAFGRTIRRHSPDMKPGSAVFEG